MSLVSESTDIGSRLRSGLAPAEPSMAGVRDYFELMKPRVMSLVVFTALVGLMIAPGHLHPVLAFTALLCIAVGAGAAGALNMWYDADIDAVMSRTANRPIPAGRATKGEALGLGLICSGFSVAILGLATNWVAAALLAFTIFFYAVVYTMWLKRSTPQNIVIGGAAGAFPPMIGWAAVTGDLSLPSIILFLIIFLWTPPHFWALALYKQGDYQAAGKKRRHSIDGPTIAEKPWGEPGQRECQGIKHDLTRGLAEARDDRQHRHSRAGIVIDSGERKCPEMRRRPQEDDQEQQARLD